MINGQPLQSILPRLNQPLPRHVTVNFCPWCGEVLKLRNLGHIPCPFPIGLPTQTANFQNTRAGSLCQSCPRHFPTCTFAGRRPCSRHTNILLRVSLVLLLDSFMPSVALVSRKIRHAYRPEINHNPQTQPILEHLLPVKQIS